MAVQLVDSRWVIRRTLIALICLLISIRLNAQSIFNSDNLEMKITSLSNALREDGANTIIAYGRVDIETSEVNVLYRIDSQFFFTSYVWRIVDGKMRGRYFENVKIQNECIEYQIWKEYGSEINRYIQGRAVDKAQPHHISPLLRLPNDTRKQALYIYDGNNQTSNFKLYDLFINIDLYKRSKGLWCLLSAISNRKIYVYGLEL